jgi:hypothetical protein
MSLALSIAVGDRGEGGMRGSKESVLEREVLRPRVEHSAHATIAPGGPLGLALDEIAVPQPLLPALGIQETRDDPPWPSRVWIKRNPVLHRWGIVPVRIRVMDDGANVIRLPASLLGPMNADFDGDTVTLFTRVPWLPADAQSCQPAAIAWDEPFNRPMFIPKKQYLYGLFLLLSRSEHLSKLKRDLEAQDAPAFAWSEIEGTPPTTAGSFDRFLARIVKSWSDPANSSQIDHGRWWATLDPKQA